MKSIKKLIICLLIFICVTAVLNLPLTTKQGIDGVLTVKRIPLYVKACGFFYRDYQYFDLAREITRGITDDNSRVKAIYEWTVQNIKRQPSDLPVIDDHIWDIIVRRYGTSDQMADVFTTLASYAGYEAFWDKGRLSDTGKNIILSFVKIGGTWYIFDIDNKRYLLDMGELTDDESEDRMYAEYMKVIDGSKFRGDFRRPDKQKIVHRILYEIKGIFKK